MKILIAGRSDSTENYVNAMTKLSATPLVSLQMEDCNDCDGLLLPGGGDINPSFWGEEPCGSSLFDTPLDTAQLLLTGAFVKSGKPILGICKGMQIINVYFGGTIIQHLPSAAVHKYTDCDQIHFTTTTGPSFLQTLYGSAFYTNSAHHQGVGLLGQNLCAIQYSRDSVMEALAHKTLPIIGVQWHPERMCFSHKRPDTVDGSRLLRYFLSLCERSSEKTGISQKNKIN